MLHSSAPMCGCRQRTADLRKGMGTADRTVKQSRRHNSARGALLFDVFSKHCCLISLIALFGESANVYTARLPQDQPCRPCPGGAQHLGLCSYLSCHPQCSV